MSQPVLRFEETDKTGMADLHNELCGLAEVSFSLRGSFPPTWVIGMRGRRIVIETAWDDDDEQMRSRDFICMMIHLLGCTAYSFASEAYAARLPSIKGESEADARKRADAMAEKRLSSLPEDHRDEIVWVMSHQKADQTMLFSKYLINSKRIGRMPFLGPRIDEDPWDRMEGRMTDLFRRKPHPEMMARAQAVAAAFFAKQSAGH